MGFLCVLLSRRNMKARDSPTCFIGRIRSRNKEKVSARENLLGDVVGSTALGQRSWRIIHSSDDLIRSVYKYTMRCLPSSFRRMHKSSCSKEPHKTAQASKSLATISVVRRRLATATPMSEFSAADACTIAVG